MRRRLLRALRLASLPLAVVFLPAILMSLTEFPRYSSVPDFLTRYPVNLVRDVIGDWYFLMVKIGPFFDWVYRHSLNWKFVWGVACNLIMLASLVWWFWRPSRLSGIVLTVSIYTLWYPLTGLIYVVISEIIRDFGS